MHAMDLTDDEARWLKLAAKQVAMPRSLRTKVAALVVEPLPVKCYHCREVQASREAYYSHLLEVERYPEEDAGSLAWSAFEKATW